MVTFKKVQQSVKYVKYSEAKPGDVIAEGTFISTEMVDNYDRTGKVPQHRILTEEGDILALNSAGQLNYLMSQVPSGAVVRVTFMGKEKIKNKKTGRVVEANQFEVEVADDSELLSDEEAV